MWLIILQLIMALPSLWKVIMEIWAIFHKKSFSEKEQIKSDLRQMLADLHSQKLTAVNVAVKLTGLRDKLYEVQV